ncbi:LysR family transcriptional regulator [Thalassospira marina]|uniref:LysR family transcriptional regulator n=1 Tax=Thalassospira marina TaxID=2048283 RepID=A0A2N3KTL7_9PROT|nr:LysR family transcriptional regulator [Thalassospira marina]PKR53867.1 LysR family transcriptional regulator [Thalassospira marina]
MNLRQLRYFVTLAEELHFSRAAERMNMTQPPFSQAIIALEQELGVTLFNRTKRHVELTAVGEHWLECVRKVLDNAEQLPLLAKQIAHGEIGVLKFGFVSTAAYSLLPRLVADFRLNCPDVKLDLEEMTSDLQAEAILNREIDVGMIIPAHQMFDHSLEYLPMLREPLVATVPKAWIENGRITCVNGKIRLAEIAQHPLIIFPRRIAPAFYDIITRYFSQSGYKLEIGQEAIQMQTIISLVSSGLGIALVPEALRNLDRTGTCYVPLEGAPPVIETGLVWRREDSSPAVKRLINLAKPLAIPEKVVLNLA